MLRTSVVDTGLAAPVGTWPRSYLDQFNFYYEMTQGDRTMHMIGGECQYLLGNMEGSASKLEKTIGYTGNNNFANVGIVVFRDYARCGS